MANLSQQNRERMLAFLEELKKQHTDDNSLIAIGEIERELTAKKYGLVWERHEEEVDIKMRTHIPVFVEDKSREIVAKPDSTDYNFLLEGDNLHSLKLLEKTHRGKIDVIYIDPPYNTGGNTKNGTPDFIYDDSIVAETDGYRHSKWLSFIESRLSIAHKLLKKSGMIFISIDDNEFAQLKLICDSIFSSQNFVGNIIWKKKTNGNNMGFIPPVHDYILCYAASIDNIYDMGYEISKEENMSKYSNPDNDPRGPWTTTDLSANHRGPHYAITNPETGDVFYPPDGRYWVFNEEETKKRIADGRIIFGKSGKTRPVQKVFARDREDSTKRRAESWWDKHGLNADATKELKDVFGKAKVFTHPKPTELIKKIITMCCGTGALILDFFAGSGTTGQAVLELNREDGGNRHFILCTNNENRICEEITYQRLKTVITGKRADGSEYSDGIPANLMYYKTDFVAKDSDELSDELLEHIIEMIQLEYGVRVDGRKYVMIMSDEEMDDFERNRAAYKDLRAVFVSQDVLLSAKQEQMLRKLSSFVIPDYYFDFELREAGELW